ncbi:unnamed protein product [Paramecium sonneborni]|uniref:Uncharacterized protein n=1 Tax=Paramecium sonneborni TaxID=65129 RepID=A0A8S1K224_9CILI|nr:unnamed protein product [Paramecium sonneborni]
MKKSLIIVITIIKLVYGDQCSEVADIGLCLKTSNFCYILEANVPYLSADNQKDGVVLDKVNDKCMSLNFYTRCDQLVTKESCKLGSCLWDPMNYECYEWDQAPCQSYSNSICQWNPNCELVNQTQTLDLLTNFTLMNNVDNYQKDGRIKGTWLYEFGQIISVQEQQKDQETYLFTKCQLKNQCELIQIIDASSGIFQCHESELGCYFDAQQSKCITISHTTNCADIKWKSRCESGAAPCIWLGIKCVEYNDPDIPCSYLGTTLCLNNEKCYLEGANCKSYLRCNDFKTKQSCDNDHGFKCYFDDYENQCKLLTTSIPCKQRGINNCDWLGTCEWNNNNDNSKCQGKLLDYYCQSYSQSECISDTASPPQCDWDQNLQICYWKFAYDCPKMTYLECDKSGTCFYDYVLNQCQVIQATTKCELMGQISCSLKSNQLKNLCQWSTTRNLCISIFDFACEDLLVDFCTYREKCYKSGNMCKTRKQCHDNIQIVDCWDDQTQSCYYDFDQQICRRITAYSPCEQIFRENSCNQAICAWLNGQCLNLEDVSCSELTLQNCKYSSQCQYFNSECIPLDQCGVNDGNQETCILDSHHCYYNPETKKCIQIDGQSECKFIVGADNCNYGACVLQPGLNKKLQCIEYENADCSFLKKEYCNFGQCTWNVTQCVSYPYKIQNVTIIDNPNVKNNSSPTDGIINDQNQTTISSYGHEILLISILAFFIE